VVDLVLLDLGLPDAQGLDALRRAQPAAPRLPLVVHVPDGPSTRSPE
jgi:DNA-binding response OmpR family regulator